MTRSRAAPRPVELPTGCHCRRPQPGDVPAIVDLMNAVDIADVGIADNSAEDVNETWALPRFNIERDAWL